MRSGLVLALDRMGCLQTARCGGVRNRSQQHIQPQLKSAPVPGPDNVPEIHNDAGLREVPVSVSTVVCTGKSPPEDHPHVALRIERDGSITCPYCRTRYRLW